MSPATVLEVTDLRVGLRRGDGEVPVLDGVSLTVAAGECVAVVGESGAGKTVLALAVVALLPPVMRVVGGGIRVAGTEVVGASDATTRALRGGAVGMV
ncbi:MAG: ATP-binding cassette domain-containing protein, partial [Actinomycetota bacterium]